MRYEIKKLQKHFPTDFEKLLEEASNALNMIGMEIISHNGYLTIQYDYKKIDHDPVSKLIFMILTGKELDINSTEKSMTPLSRSELAVLGVILGIVESEKKSKIPLIEVKKYFEDIMAESTLTGNLTKLRRKEYIKLNESTIEIDWRTKVELGIKTGKIKNSFQQKEGI